MDGRGVPLSIIVTGANRHDVTQVSNVMDAMMLTSKPPSKRRSKHLCADAGYASKEVEVNLCERGYIPHIKGRGQEVQELKKNPSRKARRWVVEVAHSCFNRFRKLLVRYEKLERSFLALNYLAAAIITLRKIKAKVNIIYG